MAVGVKGAHLLVVALAFICASGAAAQELDDPLARRDTVWTADGPPYQIEPFILPGSVQLELDGLPVDTARYQVDHRYGELFLDPPVDAASDTLVARYRILPLGLRAIYRSQRRRPPPEDVRQDDQRRAVERPAPATALQARGSIRRGVVGGSRQDATLESGLRLELSGELAEDVTVDAVVTDENTPVLPEGTTQRLRDLDRVFVRLGTPWGGAALGDIGIEIEGHQLNPLRRRVQGAALTARPGQGHSMQIAGAVTRGTYRSDEVDPIDGVQGPYRLAGSGETLISLIVAGSERVYVNGVSVERGRNRAYVIDYATGEITFTDRVIVTDQTRIRVEYEYADEQFSTGLLAGRGATRLPLTMLGEQSMLDLSVSYALEQDGTLLAGSDLTAADSVALRGAGDEPVRRATAVPTAYDAEAPFVQYTQELQGGREIFVPVRERPPDSVAVFRVRFSRVGDGSGSYRRADDVVNGIAYEFVGEGAGAYEPVRTLPSPDRHQVLGLRSDLSLSNGVTLSAEWAHSDRDENLLSSLDDGDNAANALDMTAGWEVEAGAGVIALGARHRSLPATFRPFERVRRVEFDREWNLAEALAPSTVPLPQRDEALSSAGLSWRSTGTVLSIEGGRLARGASEALRLRAAATADTLGGWALRTENTWVSNDRADAGRGALLRSEGSIQEVSGSLRPQLRWEAERRVLRSAGERLEARSTRFGEVDAGIEGRGERLSWYAGVGLRREAFPTPDSSRFGDASDAVTTTGRLRYDGGQRFNTDLRLTWRRRFGEATSARRGASSALYARWKGAAARADGALAGEWRYGVRSERAPTLREIYVRSGLELGRYVWEDANEDGVIQLDEMIPETTPNEGSYIRTYVPSDSLLSATSVDLWARLQWEPARAGTEGSGGWQRMLRPLSTRTTVQLQDQNTTDALGRLYLLDPSILLSTGSTVEGNMSVEQLVELYRRRRDLGARLEGRHVRTLVRRATGFERTIRSTAEISGRWRPHDAVELGLAMRTTLNRSASDAFASRRYRFTSREAEPRIEWEPAPRWRLRLTPTLARRVTERIEAPVWITRVPLSTQWNGISGLLLSGRLEFSDVTSGASLQPAGLFRYELTDGRGLGRSWLWSVRAERELGSGMRLTASYDGRTVDRASDVHTVRVELQATF